MGIIALADAGVYDDPEQAAAAWRAHAGDDRAAMVAATDSAALACLTEVDTGDERTLRGDEPRPVMDNWFRAPSRLSTLARTLRAQGRPLPVLGSLYRDLDITVLTEPFTDWHLRNLGDKPDPEVVDVLANQWTEGALPETWFCASPGRIRFLHELISDWIDDPITHGVLALLPEWVRWLGERAGLPAEPTRALIDAAHQPSPRLGNRRGSVEAGPGGDG